MSTGSTSLPIGSTSLPTGYHGFGSPITNPLRGNTLHRAFKIVAVLVLNLFKTIVPSTGTLCATLSHRLTVYRSDLEFLQTVQPLEGTPKLGEFSNADVLVVPSVDESLKWKKELIQSAKTSIEWSFNYAGGEKFREILKLIQQQMAENKDLRVHLLLNDDCLETEDRQLLDKLAQNSHFAYLITRPAIRATPYVHIEENHVKLLCVDGYFVMGGSGVTSRMTDNPLPPRRGESLRTRLMPPAFRDTDLVGKGIVTQTMRREFFSLYGKWEKILTGVNTDRFFTIDPAYQGACAKFDENVDVIKGVQIKYIVGGPEHYSCNPITYEYSKQIYKAKKNIRLANFILNPARPICAALRKKQKSVQVIAQTIGCTTNHQFCFIWHTILNRNKRGLFDLLFEFNRTGVMYHKKVAIFDNQTTIIGSANLGYKSAYCDDENICVIKDTRVAQSVTASLENDLEDSIPVNPQAPSVLLCGFIGKIMRHVFATLKNG